MQVFDLPISFIAQTQLINYDLEKKVYIFMDKQTRNVTSDPNK